MIIDRLQSVITSVAFDYLPSHHHSSMPADAVRVSVKGDECPVGKPELHGVASCLLNLGDSVSYL